MRRHTGRRSKRRPTSLRGEPRGSPRAQWLTFVETAAHELRQPAPRGRGLLKRWQKTSVRLPTGGVTIAGVGRWPRFLRWLLAGTSAGAYSGGWAAGLGLIVAIAFSGTLYVGGTGWEARIAAAFLIILFGFLFVVFFFVGFDGDAQAFIRSSSVNCPAAMTGFRMSASPRLPAVGRSALPRPGWVPFHPTTTTMSSSCSPDR